MNLKRKFEVATGAMALILLIAASNALASMEIRGPVAEVQDSTTYAVGQDQLSGDFSGFYYDIDDDIGTEILTMNIMGDSLEEGSIQYRTESEETSFEFEEWGRYNVIGFMGEEYFAGYGPEGYLSEVSKDINLLEDGILLKVLRDDSEERVISTSNPLELEEGYELKIKNVDIDGNKAYLELYKDGGFLDEKVITPSIESASMVEKTYYFSRSFAGSGESGNEIATIAVHFKNAYRSSEGDAASVDGIFQLSDYPRMIETNERYVNMTVTNVDQNEIELKNSDRRITLGSDREIPLMMDIHIKTADQESDDPDPLRFYIYKKITAPGSYEVRGKVAEAVDGTTLEWDARNFPGFYYDLDEDLGREEISITTSFSDDSNQIYPGALIYRTSAQEKTFKKDLWGRYSSIGFLGENYFAGYIEDSYDPAQNSLLWSSSEERNPMAEEKLFKVLIDSDDELKPLGAGSVLALQEGYELLIEGVDVEGRKVHLALQKDGSDLDEKVIVLDEDLGTYLFKIPVTSSGGNNLVSIAVHFKNAYHGTEADMATVDGIWQLSDNPLTVNQGMDIDEMTVESLNSGEGEMAIEMTNEDGISLREGKKIRLMGDFYLRTADQDDLDQGGLLRFYVFREMVAEAEPDQGALSESAELSESTAPEEAASVPEKQERSSPGFSAVFSLVSMILLFLARRGR